MTLPCKNIVCRILSVLYGAVTDVRNFLFDKGIIASVSFNLPVIAIGNLAVGGTGKTPHTELLLKILRPHWTTAVLSRGYKRSTHGFRLADSAADAQTIGDEPYQVFSKFPENTVAVDEKRVHGVRELLRLFPKTEIVLLDDALQHRHIRAGLNILLTDYRLLFTDDQMLPYGSLRERPKNSKRADMIIVTKCPEDAHIDPKSYRRKLRLHPAQSLFFSSFHYPDIYPVFERQGTPVEIDRETSVLLVTGIENPTPMVQHLQRLTKRIVHCAFADHHPFSEAELRDLEQQFNRLEGKKIILTTEKDAARLRKNRYVGETIKNNLFAQPLEVKILLGEDELFIKKIYDYVRTNSTNG